MAIATPQSPPRWAVPASAAPRAIPPGLLSWAVMLTSLLPLLIACGSEQGVSRLSTTDVFLQEPASRADILWVIDNSGSMAVNQERVAQGFEVFASSLDETNIDFQLGVITTDMDLDNPEAGHLIGDPPFLTPDDDYLGLFRERVQVGTEGSGKEKGLSAALDALSEPTLSGANEGFLREDVITSIIFVSDEEDCSDNEALAGEVDDACYLQDELLIDIDELIEDYRELRGDASLLVASGIIGTSEGTWPGRRYRQVIEATGGVIGSICDPDYGDIMDRLGLPVAGIRTVFQLSRPAVEGSIEVAVDEDLIPEDAESGWTYDASYYQIRFDGSYAPPRGATISVTYEVAR